MIQELGISTSLALKSRNLSLGDPNETIPSEKNWNENWIDLIGIALVMSCFEY